MFGGTSQDRGSPLGRSLNRPTQYGKLLRMVGAAACAMVLFALTVVGTAKPAWASHRHHHSTPDAGACGGSITPATFLNNTGTPVADNGPFNVGDTVNIQATILNSNATTFTVTNVQQDLSCPSGATNFFDCDPNPAGAHPGPDDNAITYLGNITTTCGVTWNANTSTPGLVIFTPATPLTLAASGSCSISFDEKINNIGVSNPGSILAFDADEGNCNTAPPTPGSAQGSILFNVLSCAVEIDKQVSCDGGMTFFDVSGVDDTEPPSMTLSSLCIGFNAFGANPATNIVVRYKARNTGNVDATCSTSNADSTGDTTQGLFDSNLGILPAGVTVTSIPATQTGYMLAIPDTTVACSSALSASEPDTATLVCQCATGNTAEPIIFAPESMDSATFACESPNLAVTKTCGTANTSGNSAVTVSYDSAAGSAALSGCTLTDTVFAGPCVMGAPSSTTVVGSVTGIPATLTDPTSTATTVTGLTATGLTNTACTGADCCNQATVNCNVTGSPGPETISASGVADCPIVSGDCFTRTPGFWGTHPKAQDLIIAESPFDIVSCGVDLDTSLANTQGSGTEDICSIGGGKKNPPQTTISNTQRQLERQCAAANYNLAVSAFENVSCEGVDPGINTTVATCCNNANSVCNTGGDTNGCIGLLDAFNNFDFTTIVGPGSVDATDFGPPGAQPAQCQASKKSGFVNARPRP
jgi:hypothetical protein